MKNLYFLISIITIFLITPIAHATISSPQFTIKGVVISDTDSTGIDYSTVSLVREDKVVNAVYTDMDGKFALNAKSGKYTIRVSLIGYQSDSITLNLTSDTTLNPITLKQGLTANQVTVRAQLVTTDLDKTTYNTAADPESNILNGLEMMRKVPMVAVDGDDNISINGQSGVKILLNGKPSNVLSNNYKEYLKSMPANSIKKIEVITDPPARYEAEGVAGIINIITTSKGPKGFGGSVKASANQHGGFSAGGNLMAATDKFNISARYNYELYSIPFGLQSLSQVTTYYNNPLISKTILQAEAYGDIDAHFGAIEASYQIDTLNLITASVSTSARGEDFNLQTTTNDYDHNGNIIGGYYEDKHNDSPTLNLLGSIDYVRTFKKRKESSITASYLFSLGNTDPFYDINRTFNLTGDTQNIHSTNTTTSSEHNFQFDYFDQINKSHQVEAGAKYTLRPNTSNSEDLLITDAGQTTIDGTKNSFDYTQHIISAYASYKFSYKKFSTRAGIRAEQTIDKGAFTQEKTEALDNNYLNFIPYLSLGYKLDDKSSFKLNYSQRLNRPSIWYLNPYVNYRDPLEVAAGNPDLESTLTHSTTASYSYNSTRVNISAAVGMNNSRNAIERIYTQLENGTIFSRPENIGHKDTYKSSIYVASNFFDQKLRVSVFGYANYNVIKANNGTGEQNEGLSYGGNLNISSQPWKNGSVSLGAGYYFDGVALQSQSTKPYYFANMSVGHWFLKRTLGVTVSCQNILWQFTGGGEKFTPNFLQESQYHQNSSQIKLQVNWKFGKMQSGVKKAKRQITNEDLVGTR